MDNDAFDLLSDDSIEDVSILSEADYDQKSVNTKERSFKKLTRVLGSLAVKKDFPGSYHIC